MTSLSSRWQTASNPTDEAGLADRLTGGDEPRWTRRTLAVSRESESAGREGSASVAASWVSSPTPCARGATSGTGQAPDQGLPTSPAVWLVAVVLAILVVLVLVRQAGRGGEYARRLQGFSRNARLLVVRSPFAGLSVSMWRLLFYLGSSGFRVGKRPQPWR